MLHGEPYIMPTSQKPVVLEHTAACSRLYIAIL